MASIYLHIPFCKQRCIYCDFYFVTTHRSTVPFVNALNKEIMHQAQFYGSAEPIDTIYFGGGTPSLLTVEQVHSILETVSSCYDTSPVREITFELNPDDVDITYLTALRNTGVNRLSIGVQSFFDDDLQWMHRAHSSEQARNILEWAYAAGFDNFSVDLIFGLPTQSFSTWVDNLGLLVGFRPAHISTYSLTVEPRTPLYKRVQHNKEHVVSDEMMARLYRETMQILLGEGYEHYEVSSFALPGFRSMHNQSYWAHNNYLGFGPSAHSFWAGATGEALRWENERNLPAYVDWPSREAIPVSFQETLTRAQLMDEYIMLRLRTREGINLNHLKSVYAYDLQVQKKEAIERMKQDNLIHIDTAHSLTLTSEGFLVCDAITSELLG